MPHSLAHGAYLMLPLHSFVLLLPTFVSALWGMGYGGGGDYKVDTMNSIRYKEKYNKVTSWP